MVVTFFLITFLCIFDRIFELRFRWICIRCLISVSLLDIVHFVAENLHVVHTKVIEHKQYTILLMYC